MKIQNITQIYIHLYKEADRFISFSPPLIIKRNVIDMSVYILEDDISIMIPYPTSQTSNGFGALAAPFQTKVSYESFREKVDLALFCMR